jgi:hypothetical protein
MSTNPEATILAQQLEEVKRQAREHITRLREQLARAELDKADTVNKLQEATEQLKVARQQGTGALSELARRGNNSTDQSTSDEQPNNNNSNNNNNEIIEQLKKAHAEELEAGKRQYEEYINKVKSHALTQINKLKEELENAKNSSHNNTNNNTNNDLTTIISELQSRVAILEEEKINLTNELAATMATSKQTSNNNTATTTTTSSEDEETVELRSELARFQKEQQDTQEQFSNLERENAVLNNNATAGLDQVARLNDQVTRLEAERSMLIEYKESAAKEIESLTNQLQVATIAVEEARNSSSHHNNNNNNNNVVLEIELEKLRGEIEQLRMERDQTGWSHAEALEQSRAQIDALRAEVEVLSSQTGTNNNNNSTDTSLQNELEISANQLKEALSKIQELEEQNQNLSQLLEQSRTEIQQAKDELNRVETIASDESMKYKLQIEKLTTDLNTIKQQQQQQTTSTTTNDSSSELTKLRADIIKVKEAAKKEITRLREELDVANKKNTNNNNNNATTNSEYKTIPDLEKELSSERIRGDRLAKELAKAEETVARLAEQVASSQSSTDKAISQHEQKLTVAEAHVEALQLELARLKQDTDEKKQHLKAMIEKLESERNDAMSRHTEAQAALTVALAEIVALKKNPLMNNGNGSGGSGLFNSSAITTAIENNHKSNIGGGIVENDAQARFKAEVQSKEATEEAKRAKREHALAKRESIVLADALDKLKLAIKKADMLATGELSLASDRCTDALRTVAEYVDSSLSALDPNSKRPKISLTRSMKSSGAGGSSSSGVGGGGGGAGSTSDDPLDTSSFHHGPQSPRSDLDHLVETLKGLEDRLDWMTEISRALLPSITRMNQFATLKGDHKKSGGSGNSRGGSGNPCWDSLLSLLNLKSSSERIEPIKATKTEDGDEEEEESGDLESNSKAYSKIRAAVAGGNLDDSSIMEETPTRPRPTHAQLQLQQQS